MTKNYQSITVTPISRFVGAEISGVDIASGLSDAQFSDIRQAYVEHGVIFFAIRISCQSSTSSLPNAGARST